MHTDTRRSIKPDINTQNTGKIKNNNILQKTDLNICCSNKCGHVKPLHTSACVVLRLARLLGREDWFLRHTGDKGF